jgi:predicted GNAT family acetyltransferase
MEMNIEINETDNQIEAKTNDGVLMGKINYLIEDNVIVAYHTEAKPEYSSLGVGTALVKRAIAFTRENNYKMVPSCPFIAKYIENHPEHSDILA